MGTERSGRNTESFSLWFVLAAAAASRFGLVSADDGAPQIYEPQMIPAPSQPHLGRVTCSKLDDPHLETRRRAQAPLNIQQAALKLSALRGRSAATVSALNIDFSSISD